MIERYSREIERCISFSGPGPLVLDDVVKGVLRSYVHITHVIGHACSGVYHHHCMNPTLASSYILRMLSDSNYTAPSCSLMAFEKKDQALKQSRGFLRELLP